MDVLLECHEESMPITAREVYLPQEDIEEMLSTLFRRELNCRPNAKYLFQIQKDGMTRNWRNKVIVWMNSIAESVEFNSETTALALNYLDRYLSVVSVKQHELELLTLVCIMCASKFNEKESLSAGEVAQMIEERYTTGVILALEQKLMKVLEWRLHAALPEHFIDCWVSLLENETTATLVADECSSMLPKIAQDYSSLEFQPSEVAYSVLCLALQQLNLTAQLPSYGPESNRLNECEDVIESILCSNASVGSPTRNKTKKRACSPSNVEDFFEEAMPARQRRRVDTP